MKKLASIFCFLATVLCAGAQNLTINQKFPIDKLDFYKNTPKPKIVVFMPSLFAYKCEYASMLTHSLNRYYKQGLTFEHEKCKPSFDIILVVSDSSKWEKQMERYLASFETPNFTEGLIVACDTTGKYGKQLGISEYIVTIDSFYADSEAPLTGSQSSILFLLDRENTILYKDENYRSQGEHLKPLDNFIKQKFCNTKINISKNKSKLKVGDKAPDFLIHDLYDQAKSNTLYRDTQNLKILTFYPAAFSGAFTPVQGEGRGGIPDCIGQIKAFDFNLLQNVHLKRFVITNTTNALLKQWQEMLGTRFVSYLNDADNTIATKYNVLHPKGYNNRCTYVIDKNNTIIYIDEDFTAEDEGDLKSKISNLLDKK
jgi:peroxiredoxin